MTGQGIEPRNLNSARPYSLERVAYNHRKLCYLSFTNYKRMSPCGPSCFLYAFPFMLSDHKELLILNKGAFVAALGVEPSIAPVMNVEHDRRLITVFPFHSTADQVSALWREVDSNHRGTAYETELEPSPVHPASTL